MGDYQLIEKIIKLSERVEELSAVVLEMHKVIFPERYRPAEPEVPAFNKGDDLPPPPLPPLEPAEAPAPEQKRKWGRIKKL